MKVVVDVHGSIREPYMRVQDEHVLAMMGTRSTARHMLVGPPGCCFQLLRGHILEAPYQRADTREFSTRVVSSRENISIITSAIASA